MEEEQQSNGKKYSLSTIIITALAVIIIVALAVLFYYYSTRPEPSIPEELGVVVPTPVKKIAAPQIIPTNVIKFAPPAILPTDQKNGNCFASSAAQPFRQDAFRCMVGNSIYDPCFTVAQNGFVYCQVNTDVSTGFLLKLTQALPKVSLPQTMQTNWAWFLKLKDGTECSPFTGTRPFFSQEEVAYYGCNSNNKDEQVVLIGDLTESEVWTAKEAILIKNGANWTIKSSQQVDIETVWQ